MAILTRGTPRHNGRGDYYSVTVRIDKELYDAIEMQAFVQHSSKRVVINRLLRAGIQAEEAA